MAVATYPKQALKLVEGFRALPDGATLQNLVWSKCLLVKDAV
ncbi:hypothetical protein [Microseira wollei]|nr:hypothetical protein [Microseira wollei]